MMPNTRLEAAQRAFPVPRWGVGKISGVKLYRTAYMMLLKKLSHRQRQINH